MIIIIVVYAPPWYDVSTRRELSNYIMTGIYFFSSKFTNAGFFVVGDYNQLDTSFLEKRLRFKQLVKHNTRGEKILDKIFTNLSNYYGDATVLPPLGKSDHNCVVIEPNSLRSSSVPIGKSVIHRRNFPERVLLTIYLRLIGIACTN